MMDQNILIRTQWGCAVVTRTQRQADGTIMYERATNATELALAALAVVADAGGTRWIDAEYACPVELATQARWATESLALAA